MSRRITVMFQPFDAKQTILVIEDGVVIYTAKIDYDNIVPTVRTLMTQYNVEEIALHGSNTYMQKMQAEMFNKYGKSVKSIKIG